MNLSYEVTQNIGKHWGTIYLFPSIHIGYDNSFGSMVIFIGAEFLFWSLYINLIWEAK